MRRVFIVVVSVMIAAPMLATEPNPSARQRELITKILDLAKGGGGSATVANAILSHFEKQLLDRAASNGADPGDIEETKDLLGTIRKRLGQIEIADTMHEEFVRLYAKYFTEEELAAILAFYQTPAGQKVIEVTPQLMREAIQTAMEQLQPKVNEIMAQAMDEQQKRRPWRRTMSDIRTVATALEAYALDHDDNYPSCDYASLNDVLVPNYVRSLPAKDVWGHPYAYVVSEDRHHYRIISAGADTNFEWDSLRIEPAKEGDTIPRYRDRLEDDLIYAGGSFIQLPVQVKPKSDK